MLEDFVASLGLSERLASVATIALTGDQIARDPEGSLPTLAEACAACVRDDGADVVILGGAALVGLAERLADRVPVPLICSATAAVAMTLAVARARSTRTSSPAPPVESVGLSPALARTLARRA